MLIVVASMVVVGRLAERNRRDRGLIILLGFLFVYLALARGFYWDVFGRGEGPVWFTYNRISAAIVFVLSAIAGAMLAKVRPPGAGVPPVP